MKALITFKYTKEEFDELRSLGYEVIYKKESEIEFTEDIKDIDLIICLNIFDKVDISKFPNLKWIQLISAGINHVPIDIVVEKDILLTNNRGCYSIPIAEWNVLKVLEMLKNSREIEKQQAEKDWYIDYSLQDLNKKTVGFIGTGSIATESAKRFKAFGVDILGLNTTGHDQDCFDKCFSTEEVNKFVSKCDIVIVTSPYTEQTHHLVSREVFENMKDGVYIVNIARGAILDEEALIDNLRSGKIKKAALDVFEEEPLPEGNPLWEMENVHVSSHTSFVSPMNHERRFFIAYENMKRFINNEGMLNVVDIGRGY